MSKILIVEDETDLADIDPKSFLKSVKQTFSQSAAKKRVGLDFNVEENTGLVKADKDRLMQIMVNLVDNAIKHTFENGKVELKCRRIEINRDNAEKFEYPQLDENPLLPEKAGKDWTKSFIEFRICDNGEGIPPKSLPRLMERFYRVNHTRSRELGGTGLGLSIVKHMVLTHGGLILIESELEKGTTVRFILPG